MATLNWFLMHWELLAPSLLQHGPTKSLQMPSPLSRGRH